MGADESLVIEYDRVWCEHPVGPTRSPDSFAKGGRLWRVEGEYCFRWVQREGAIEYEIPISSVNFAQRKKEAVPVAEVEGEPDPVPEPTHLVDQANAVAHEVVNRRAKSAKWAAKDPR